MTTTAAQEARNYLDSARAAREHLRELHAARDGSLAEKRRNVAALNDDLRFALQAAKVCSTLAVADAIHEAGLEHAASAQGLVDAVDRLPVREP